jgi:putative membrane protein
MTKARGRISSDREKRQWIKVLIRWRCSVLPAIFPRVVGFGIFGLLVTILYKQNLPVSLPILSSIVPSVVLGLLLVFRTNTAYERFWEGRKLWGVLVNTVRNLARQVWVSVEENEPADHVHKEATLRLLVAFAVATKLHLRAEPVNEELIALMPEIWYKKLKEMNNPPLEIAFWIGDYLQNEYEKKNINAYQLTSMFKLLDLMVDVLGGCERILKTPIPLAYSIHLKQLILLYCLALPFQVVSELNWWTGLGTALISFTIFGIEEIGIEIENPFGHDPNDLPLDLICTTMKHNIEDLITLAPCVRHWRGKLEQ